MKSSKPKLSSLRPLLPVALIFGAVSAAACASKSDPAPSSAPTPTSEGGTTTPSPEAGTVAPVTLTLVDCSANKTDPKCVPDLNVATIGTGPRLTSAQQAHTFGGFVEGTKLIMAADLVGNLDDKSVIANIDLVTGERKIVSGKYEDPANGTVNVGEGPALFYPYGIHKAPDGSYIVVSSDPKATVSLIKVDPATGNRTALWSTEEGGSASCGKLANKPRFSAQNSKGLAVGPDGESYVAFTYPPPGTAAPIPGIARIKADKTCEVVTLKGTTDTADDVGDGPDIYGLSRGFTFRDGAVWLVTFDESSIFSVDVATGKRTRFSSSKPGTLVGAGDAEIGKNSLSIDTQKNIVWTADNVNTGFMTLTSVDAKGDRTNAMGGQTFGPITGTKGSTPQVWVIPGSSYVALEHGEGIMVYDPATRNSNVVSH